MNNNEITRELDIMDFVEFFDENTDISIFPNNCVEDLAEALECANFTTLEIVANPYRYDEDDDVIYIDSKRRVYWTSTMNELYWRFENAVKTWLAEKE